MTKRTRGVPRALRKGERKMRVLLALGAVAFLYGVGAIVLIHGREYFEVAMRWLLG